MTTLHTDTLKVHIISQIMEMRDAYFLAKLDKLIQEVKEEADILQRLATPYADREKHLQIIAKGGDVSYIENPMEWQREQRKDRDLPFRN